MLPFRTRGHVFLFSYKSIKNILFRKPNTYCDEMKLMTVLILVSVFSAITFYYLASMGEVTLGLIFSAIMFCWPIGLWTVSKLSGSTPTFQDPQEMPKTQEVKEKIEMPPKDVNALRETLMKLKSVTSTIEDEKRQGMISEGVYNELMSHNKAAIDRLEKEISS
jgi:hypothetical protein